MVRLANPTKAGGAKHIRAHRPSVSLHVGANDTAVAGAYLASQIGREIPHTADGAARDRFDNDVKALVAGWTLSDSISQNQLDS